MIELDFADGKFRITASPLERDIALRINGAVAERGSATSWTLPYTWACYVDAGSTVREAGGIITPEARKEGSFLASQARALRGMKDGPGAEGQTLGEVELFPGQDADADWLVEAGGQAFLFSDMRTGKSFTALAAIDRLPEAFPLLIVSPPGVVFEWERNVQRAFPDRTYSVISNGMTPSARRKELTYGADIVICTYANVALHSKLANFGGVDKLKRAKEIDKGMYEERELNTYGFRSIIADEAHSIKNPKSQATRACWQIGDKAAYRLALTGTPTSTATVAGNVNPQDLWALLRFIRPESFPARGKFQEKYLLMTLNFFGVQECRGIKPGMEKYWSLVFEPMYLRRERTIETAKDYRVIPVELSSKQRKVYDQLVKFEMAQLGDELLSADEGLLLRRRLLQATSAMPLVQNGKIDYYTLPSAKAEALLEWLNESPEKAIVFTADRLLFDLVEGVLVENEIQVASYPGGLTPKQQAEAVDRFRDNPNTRVFLGMTQAANAGIDLSAGKRIAFLTLSDNGVQNAQAEDRNLGPTQAAAVVEVAYFVAKDTIDEDTFDMNNLKRTNNKNLLDPAWWKARV